MKNWTFPFTVQTFHNTKLLQIYYFSGAIYNWIYTLMQRLEDRKIALFTVFAQFSFCVQFFSTV